MARIGNTFEFSRCNNCKKTARSKEDVLKKFGERNNGGYIIIQSWCRVCRNLK